MQKRKTKQTVQTAQIAKCSVTKRIACLLLMLLTVFPLFVSTALTVSAASGWRVIGTSSGQINYVGKNYSTGATGQSLVFDLNSGFLVQDGGGKEYWATCGEAGYDAPPSGTAYNGVLELKKSYLIDGYDISSKKAFGSHYIGEGTGSSRKIDLNFIFRCFYYANKYEQTEFKSLSARNGCTLQEAIALAYRYEWDTRLIKYKTGEMVSGSWRLNENPDTWGTNGNLTSVTTNSAIVDAANAILKYAFKDPDGIKGSIIQTSNMLTYTDPKSKQACTLQLIESNAAGTGKVGEFQNLLVYSPISTVQPYTIRVEKYDENKNKLNGAVFSLYKKNGSGSYVNMNQNRTITNGVAEWYDLDAGDYYVKEIAAPPGYRLDDTEHRVTLGGGSDQTVTIEVYNFPEDDYIIWLRKWDEDGNRLTAAYFSLYKRTSGNNYTFVSNKWTINGNLRWTGLAAGDYYVVETKAPAGYILDTTKHYVTLNESTPGHFMYLDLTNPKDPPKGAIGIKKIDRNYNHLAGAKFNIYKDYKNEILSNYLGSMTTDEDGSALFGIDSYGEFMLAEGTYYVQEVEAPPGFVLDPNVYSVRVDGDEINYLQKLGTGFPNYSANDASWTAKVRKIMTGRDPEDGEFTFILEENGVELDRATNDKDGYVAFSPISYTESDIGYHRYTVRELNTGDPTITYDDHITSFEVTVAKKGDALVATEAAGWAPDRRFTNTYSGWTWTPEAQKLLEGKDLEGNDFTFVLEEDGKELQRVTNRADGRIPFEGITYSKADAGKHTYTIREIDEGDPSIDYDSHILTYTVTVTYDPATEEVTGSYSVEGSTTFHNTYSANGAIAVKKVNADGKPLAGVVFVVCRDPEAFDVAATISTDSYGIAYYGRNSDGSMTLTPGSTYYLREMVPPIGYTADTKIYPVTVVAGQITYVNNGDPVINYPFASWKPEVNKVMEGSELKANEFTFVLEENGKELQRVTNNADGSIPFAAIRYELADVGEHTYTVHEIAGSDPSIDYDTHTVTFVVNVAKTSTGSLTASLQSTSGSTTFTNKHTNPTGSWTPSVNKVLRGRDLKEDEFTFVLEKDGRILQTVKNKADGSIPFVGIDYTMEDVGKTYRYTIREISGGGSSVSFDTHTVTFDVKITYGGTGTELTVTETVYGNTTFTNYVPTGSWTPSVNKVLEGRDLKANEFTFVLEQNGKELQRVTNLADGSIPFAAISYGLADVGTHTYTVREIAGSDTSVSYDGHTVTFTVTVSYSGTGTELTVTDSATGSKTFTNSIPSGSWTPSVNKVLEGRDLTAGEFTFVLEENGNELQRVTNNADGSIPFTAISYGLADIGRHVYTVREIAGSDTSVSYDGHTVTFTVSVSYSGTGTELRVTRITMGSATFTNYVPTGSWTPEVNKVLEGRDLKANEFAFVLEQDGKELQRVRNLADGSIPFAAITYGLADVGTHTYTIREIAGADTSVSYDGHTVTFTVTVSYSGTGTALTVVDTASGSTTFTNYVPTGSWTPEVNKVLEGRDLTANEFTFVLEKNGQVIQTVKNLADGSIPFAAITYGLADVGTHTYTVREIAGTDTSVSYDGHTVTYTVSVSYSGTGTRLTITDTASGSTTFTNYVPTGSWTPEVNKVLEGRDLTAGEFTFILEQNGRELQRVTNNADGSIPFAAITYGLADVGTHTYTIREIAGADTSVSYDGHTVTFTVSVSYSGTGTRLTVTDTASGSTTFTNYVPIGSWTPEVNKTLEGRDLTAGEFTFVLEENGAELQRVTNNADGSIPFTAISYGLADVGTHTYTIREIAGTDTSVSYDGHTVTFTVTVSYSGTGTALTVAGSTADNTTFTNYVPTGSWTPEVDKVLEGRDLTANEFTFVLEKDGQVIQTVKNNADGSITFASLVYGLADVGTHTYTIREIAGTDTSVSYDGHTVTFTVTVSYSGTGTALTVVDTASGSTTFTNYVPTGSWTPEVNKTLEGRDLTEDEFTFVLEKDGQVIQTVKNNADGSITFASLVYGLADVGTHTYTIREIAGTDTSVSYDSHIVTFTVTISYSGTGTALTVAGSTTDNTTFTNYVPIGSWTPEVNKTLEGRDLTEDEFTFVIEENGEELQRVTNLADGSIPFAEINYGLADVGKHTYTIREIVGADVLVEYDEQEIIFTVDVSYIGSGTALTISASEPDNTTFDNKLRVGKLEILKVDTEGTPLAGAEFLLEWSEDGNDWRPVVKANRIVKGGCTSEGLTDGKLVTDDEGVATFTGLHPEVSYRLTETKAPEGFQLLSSYAYEGMLPPDKDLTVPLRIINAHIFKLPPTGSNSFEYLMIALPFLCCCGATLWILGDRRRRSH